MDNRYNPFRDFEIKTMLFLVLPFFALSMALGGTYRIYLASRSTRWPKEKGQVTRSHVEEETDSDNDKVITSAKLEYMYIVNGKRYSADCVSFGGGFFQSASEMRHQAALYKVGQFVTVYYNPSNPEDAVLKPGVKPALVWMVVIGYVVSAALGWFYWRGRR
jgi:hypothetical protein